MDTFREPTPEEAKMIALQFIGQNIGALKELDKNIISKNPTLQGNTLDVQGILNSIPAPQRPQPSQQHKVSHTQPIAANTLPALPATNSDAIVVALNRIASSLESITKLLEKL